MRIIQFRSNPLFLVLLFLDVPVRSTMGKTHMMEYKVKITNLIRKYLNMVKPHFGMRSPLLSDTMVKCLLIKVWIK